MTREYEKNYNRFRPSWEEIEYNSKTATSSVQNQTFCFVGEDATPEDEYVGANWRFQNQTICSAAIEYQSHMSHMSSYTLQEEDLSQASALRRFNGVRRRGERDHEDRWILFVDGVDFVFNWIPKGEFWMGFKSNEQRDYCAGCGGCDGYNDFRGRYGRRLGGDEAGRQPSCCYAVSDVEAQRHRVVITRDFWLLDTLVTVAAFDIFVKKTGRKFNGGAYGYDADSNAIIWQENINFENHGFSEFKFSRFKKSYPATCVSWTDAVDFCEWLTKEVRETERRRGGVRVDLRFRLPTEAEWEYACRAGEKGPYSFGEDSKKLPSYGNFNGFGDDDDGYSYLAPVRRFWPNSYGLYDMHGNAWEWCLDWYAPYASSFRSHVADPSGPRAGERRVVRGGAWNNDADSCRSATRGAAEPQIKAVNLGFRVVMDVVR